MRICFTNFSDLDEPTTINAFHLAEELVKLGHEVTMLLPRLGKRYVTHRARSRLRYFGVLAHPREAKMVSTTIVQTLHALRQRFDLIQSFKPLPQSALPAVIAGRIRSSLKVLYWDDYEKLGQLLNPRSNPLYVSLIDRFERTILSKFDGIMCVSSFLANIARGVLPSGRILTIPNGFDPEIFRRGSPEGVRDRLGVGEDENLIMYTGGLKPWADIDLLVRAMPYVLSEAPNSRLVLVGDGEAKKELMGLCDSLGISHKVIFAGGVPHEKIPDYLAAADVLALPMRDNFFNRARFPNRIAEYMAAGRPIVASRVGVVKEFLKDGYNAVLIHTELPAEFAKGILRVLTNKKKAAQMGRRAREYAWSNLTWNGIAREVEKFYSRLANA